MTLRTLTLGSRDSTTGWRTPQFTESTVKARKVPRGASFSYQGVGVYAREDAAWLVCDPIHVYDQVYDGVAYFQVQTVQRVPLLDSHLWYEAQCSELPLHQAVSTGATWQTAPADPRSRTKTWIDTYVSNANVVKDDGSSFAAWTCMFAEPPYPLVLEFRGTVPLDGVYAVAQPSNSTPLMDVVTQAPYGYDETLHIHILTVDSSDVTGTALNWTMERELRSVFQEYPTGSLRSCVGTRGKPIHLGSATLYETVVPLSYRRDTST